MKTAVAIEFDLLLRVCWTLANDRNFMSFSSDVGKRKCFVSDQDWNVCAHAIFNNR